MVISNQLDNPIWHALLSGNSQFASGNDHVKYYPSAVATFAGFRDFSDQAFGMLHEMLPAGSVRATFIPFRKEVPFPWTALPGLQIYQMLDTGQAIERESTPEPVSLTQHDVPQMLALTQLTRPGPFNEKTIDLGNFFGFFSGRMLVAMAGQRLQVDDYVEISAVCTHPEHQGRGYGRRLLLHQLQMIRSTGRTPMLHVKTDNAGAIALYQSLGFSIRRQLEVIIFRKD